jgi:hypothetical protein
VIGAGERFADLAQIVRRATAGADRKAFRSGSCCGNEFANRRIVAQLWWRWKRAASRFPNSSSMVAAVAWTCQAASGTSKPCTAWIAWPQSQGVSMNYWRIMKYEAR